MNHLDLDYIIIKCYIDTTTLAASLQILKYIYLFANIKVYVYSNNERNCSNLGVCIKFNNLLELPICTFIYIAFIRKSGRYITI